MDKYEFNVKVEQIKKLVMKKDFETAMKIADTIDWHRVRNANLLAMISQVYENNGEYQEAKEILLQAYERAPVGKRLLFKLAELALREGNVREAEEYYREFCEVAPGDPRQNLLRYLILKGRGVSVDKLIPILEDYVSTEMDEKWMYELAELYSQAGDGAKCVQICDKMILMFGLGKYVEKAMQLKVQYAPLNEYQQDLVENKDKYEAKLKAVEEEFSRGPVDMLMDDEPEEPSVRRDYPGGAYPEENGRREEYPEAGRAGNGYADEGYPEEAYAEGPYPEETYPEESYPEDEELVANLHQAAVERSLAQEVSRIAREDEKAARIMDEPTKPLYDIRRSGATAHAESFRIEDDRDQPRPDIEITEEAASAEEPRAGAEGAEARQAEGPAAEAAHANAEGERAEKLSGESVRAEEEQAERPAEAAHTGSAQAGDKEAAPESRILSRQRPEAGSAANTEEAPSRESDGTATVQEPVSSHLSIEARTPEKGLQTAIEALKEYHLANDTHNQVLKITGGKLNMRGVMNVADKLRGKDLIIEEAGDLAEDELKDLADLMADDTSGMVVVLVDNPLQMEEMYQKNPEFMQMFEHIDGEREKKEPLEQAVMRQVEEEERQAQREEAIREEAREADRGSPSEEEAPAEETVSGPEEDDYEEEMDADAFAEYACQYASQIDCSILGKSMLALYERVELMEEDGIPLTRATAEELIEEAADKAEKPSLGRLITGVFSPKYNKEGLLILREEHFI